MKDHCFKNQKISKTTLYFPTVFLSVIISSLISLSAISQNVGINSNGTPPDGSALLDLESNDKGLLIPRLTITERDAIVSPANGLMIYNKDCNIFQFWNNTSWVSFPTPTIITANAGANIGDTDFDANWSVSSGVTNYYIDVATDANFTTFVSGFNDQNVGNVATYNVTGLTCEVDYYYRVRAEDVCGSSNYSNTITVTTGSCWTCGDSFTDSRDSKSYQTVEIGTQCWMKENLNYDSPSYGNSWCYDNDPSNCITYGRLYDWAASMNGSTTSNSVPSGVQGICPSGWHLPSDAEWCQMENTVEPGTDATCNSTGWRGTNTGKKLKTNTWGGNNTSGFTALPGGRYYSSFLNMGSIAYFWSASEYNGSNTWFRDLGLSSNSAFRSNVDKGYGLSVRCVKD